jgi:hypothetical protein
MTKQQERRTAELLVAYGRALLAHDATPTAPAGTPYSERIKVQTRRSVTARALYAVRRELDEHARALVAT